MFNETRVNSCTKFVVDRR